MPKSAKSQRLTWPWMAMSIALIPSIAAAHDGTGLVGGFLSGFMHPVNGLDHLLAMVAVGLWGAILGRPLVVALPAAFPIMMAVGGVLGLAAVPLPPVELAIGISVVVLGAAIALAWKPAPWAAVLIVAAFALFHGYAHGQELPQTADPVAYSVGFVLSTGLLHLTGVGVGYLAGHWRVPQVIRGLGAVIALIGIGLLIRGGAG